MSGTINSIYAKYKNKDHYHLLIYHLIDVACVASVIADEFIKQDNFNSNLKKYFVFWAGLHDIGKASHGFQKKIKQGDTSRYRAQSDHTLLSAKVLLDKWREKYTPGTDKGDFSWCLASIIGGHHGKFIRSGDVVDLYIHDKNDYWEKSRNEMISILSGLFSIDFFDFPELNTKEITSFIMRLAGLITLSDWIGSMEEYFEYKKDLIPFENYFSYARDKAKLAVNDIFHTKIKPDLNIPDREIFKFDFRPLQEKCRSLGKKIASPAIIFIEAPTGEGKTEASWMLAKALMKKSGREGCYFALPTQATSNQMYERINEDWLSRIFSDFNQMMKSILIHSAAILHEEEKTYKITTGEAESSVAEDWFKPKKRGLLAPFAVGTVDQAFLSVMQTRHFYLRLFGLSSKVVIFDEVHAYDTYMSTIFVRLLRWLSEMGTSVIMLSATLPLSKKRSLIKAYTGTSPELNLIYPAITVASKAKGHSVESFRVSELNQKTLSVKLVGFLPENLSSLCKEKLETVGCAAVICNTVKRAQDVYSNLKNEMKGAEILLLHSRFPFAQRERLENKVIEKFGKSAGNKRPNKSVLVATQIIEQSLDLDFDFMISDLAPIDLLIQRAGRIQRHERTRPITMKRPVLYISLPENEMNSIDGLKRAGPVYDPYILLKTYLLLKDMDKIRIPEDLSRLIEDVYEFELTDEESENFRQQLKEEMFALKKHNKLKAELPLILSPNKDIEMIIEQKNEQFSDEDNPAIHQSIKARTRDAPPSLSVVFLHEIDERLYPEPVHKDRQTPINMEALPDYEITKILLKNSIRISNHHLFNQLMKVDPPEAWKKNHYLKHSRLLVFNNNKCIFNNISLKLDQEMGLIINYLNNDRGGK